MSRLLLGVFVAAGLLLAAAPAAAAEGNPTCGTRLQGTNGAYAYCSSLVYGEQVRVVLRCHDPSGNSYTRVGPWVYRSGERSVKYCDLVSHPLDDFWPEVWISTR